MTTSAPSPTPAPDPFRPHLQPGLVSALTSAYATLLKRQRAASAAFVRWSTANARSHEFAWIPEGKESVLFTGKALRIGPSDGLYANLNKMMATIQLNPYEKDLLYGYPYLIGHIDETPIRAPLLTIPVTITTDGDMLVITPNEELVRFNSLALRSEHDSAIHEQALGRLIDLTPPFPLTERSLKDFAAHLAREMQVTIAGQLNGTLGKPPSQPRAAMPLRLMDNAAIFIAPKTSYFLTSDLEEIGRQGDEPVRETALGWLLGSRGNQQTSNVFQDSKKVYFPFSSNASQRRVALLTNDPTNHISVVSGPPGTGKSLTIANLVCHLVATGQRVLVTSQKDKALEVVDELLRSLDLAELPMTLLRQDQESKRELRQRLESIDKAKSAEETQRETESESRRFSGLASDTMQTEADLADALHAEHLVAQADDALNRAQSFLQRVRLQWGLWEARRAAKHRSQLHSDHHGEAATSKRSALLGAALKILRAAAAHRTGTATRNERNHLREFSKLLAKNQTGAKNYPVFDRLKKEPERCHTLLKILPCWIMTPDDVARLFPLEAGLFDWVICDETSQMDLPSATPVLFRAKRAICLGDAKQMKATRFAFTNAQVAAQAWRQYGLERFDPDRWFDPTTSDLLQLASIRADEHVLLNEHFRSLPGIIHFSNEQWYGGQLRLMRDDADRRFGAPDEPYIRLIHVTDGYVKPGTQENEREAERLVEQLKRVLEDPAYADTSVGVLALFDEQVRLLNDLIAERIPEELRTDHDLIVSNPDGVQGDERDVIFYSLSYDANGMEQSQISARQAEREQIQGMLNVAFTRARDAMFIFHSAPIDQFGMASGKGVIRAWLEHCALASQQTAPRPGDPFSRTQSEFEAEVLQALHAKGLETISQFPACGFFIDIVAVHDQKRLAIECDGEAFHLDENGSLKQEDIIRQEILERARWKVLRIPYRGWKKHPGHHLERILRALQDPQEATEVEEENEKSAPPGTIRLSTYEAAIIHALRKELKEYEAVLRGARLQLQFGRLSSSLRHTLDNAIKVLVQRGLILVEDGELFLTEEARTATITAYHTARPAAANSPSQYRRYRRRPSRYRR